MKPKNNAKELTAQDLVNVEGITDGLIYTRDRLLIGFLGVHGAENKLLDLPAREAAALKLCTAFSEERRPYQFLSVPRTVDVQGMLEKLRAMRETAVKEAQRMLLSGEIDSLQRMVEEGAKEPVVLIKLWETAAPGADQRLKKRMRLLESRLGENAISARMLSNSGVKWLCRLYAALDVFLPQTDTDTDVPLLQGEARKISRESPDNERSRLLNDITPIGGIEFKANTLQIGNVVGRCLGVTKYNSEVDYGWLVPLMNATDAITCVTFYPGDLSVLPQKLSKSIRRSSQDIEESKDAREQKQYMRRIKGADKMLDEVDEHRRMIGHINIVAMPFTDQPEKLKDICDEVKARFATAGLECRSLGSCQEAAFKHLSPYYGTQPEIDNMLRQIIPQKTVMGGDPMTVTVLRDDNGIYFAQTADGGFISVDPYYRGRDRTDSNLISVGKSGRGKSTAIKHLLMGQYMIGRKEIVFDPEREYRDMCRNLGGTWLDAGGGVAKVNLLEIRRVPEDAEDEKEKLYASCANAMAKHIQTVKVVLKAKIPSLTDLQKSLLEDSLIRLYEAFGIAFETDLSDLGAEDYPIMEDWYKLLQKLRAEDSRYGDLALLIQSMAVGADSYIWNGYTNVDLENQLVVIDTNRLMNMSNEDLTAVYLNYLSLVWDTASRDRNEAVIIQVDEAHTFFDPRLPEASMYLRNYAKRGRKYEIALWAAFQNMIDLLDERVRLYGQALIDNSTYRLLFGCDAKNLTDTVDLFALTEAEAAVLKTADQRSALCLIGSQQHIRVCFEIPAYKLELMGKAGGR